MLSCHEGLHEEKSESCHEVSSYDSDIGPKITEEEEIKAVIYD